MTSGGDFLYSHSIWDIVAGELWNISDCGLNKVWLSTTDRMITCSKQVSLHVLLGLAVTGLHHVISRRNQLPFDH